MIEKFEAEHMVADAIDESSHLIDALCEKMGVPIPGAAKLCGLAIHDGVIAVNSIGFGDLLLIDDAFFGCIDDRIDTYIDMICDDWPCDWGKIVNGKWIVGEYPLQELRDIVIPHTTDHDFIAFVTQDSEITFDDYFGGFPESQKQVAFQIIRNII